MIRSKLEPAADPRLGPQHTNYVTDSDTSVSAVRANLTTEEEWKKWRDDFQRGSSQQFIIKRPFRESVIRSNII